MENIQAGNVIARVVNYTLSNTKAGNPQVEVLFEYSRGEGLSATHHQIRWWGQLSEKALPYTLKNLVTLGYRGTTNDDFAKLADGVEGGMIDLGVEVELVLEPELKDDGKTFLKVRYINALGGGFKTGMTREQAKVKIGALNLAGQMALIRKEMGVAPKPAKAPMARVPGEDDDSDIGF